MVENSDSQVAHGEVAEEDLRQYGAISGWAVVSVILGVTSFLALFSPVLLLLPALGAFAALIALERIRDPESGVVGRKTALVGLFLSVMFASAVPVQAFATRWWLQRESREFGLLWFELLRDQKPMAALHLKIESPQRRPLDRPEQLLSFYRQREEGRDDVAFFFGLPVVQTLLALGPRAEVRFYETEKYESYPYRTVVTNVYAVTYEDRGRRKTFFVRMEMERTVNPITGEPGWRIVSFEGGVTPLSHAQSADGA